MPTRHRGVLRLAAASAAVALLGCLSTLDAFDAREDFGRFQVWDFEPGGASSVQAPGRNEAGLGALLRRRIHDELVSRGYQYGRERPDFFVRYELSLERRKQIVYVPRAPYLMSSMSSSPSYWIWSSDREERAYDDVHLLVEIREGSGERLWAGALRERQDYGQAARIGAAVKSVLERFPHAQPRRPASPAPADQLALRLPAPPGE